ncbi:hypothetical protein IAQ61_000148 [Plenodomus lingam]|uniref:uncharacterized protein n=1 Tax=Leptosphaeria maculans TaxID=5022 RepID=UPI0033257095|nr:hypothetical protein IAQ61_000148 [Plenodomus lingam]
MKSLTSFILLCLSSACASTLRHGKCELPSASLAYKVPEEGACQSDDPTGNYGMRCSQTSKCSKPGNPCSFEFLDQNTPPEYILGLAGATCS